MTENKKPTPPIHHLVPLIITFIAALVLVGFVSTLIINFLRSEEKVVREPGEYEEHITAPQNIGGFTITPEMLARITPDPDAPPFTITPEMLARITPDPDAPPFVITEEMLKRVTPKYDQ